MADPAPAPARRLDEQAVLDAISRFERDMDRVEQVPGPTVEVALDAITTLTALYGEALARVVDAADDALLHRLSDDDLVGHLLALHGLHPEPVETRVQKVLAQIRAELGDDGRAELAGIDAGVAHIRVAGRGCGSSDGTAHAVAEAVLGEAPELDAVEPELVRPATTIPVEALLRRPERRS